MQNCIEIRFSGGGSGDWGFCVDDKTLKINGAIKNKAKTRHLVYIGNFQRYMPQSYYTRETSGIKYSATVPKI